MKQHLNKKVLVTTSAWFYAPDGKQYRAVFGTLKAIHETKETLGFTPNRHHANWVIEIGDMLITGCQVLYCVQTDECNTGRADHSTYDSNGSYNEFKRASEIYLTY